MAIVEVVAHLRANANDMVSGFRRAQGAAGSFNQTMGQSGGIASSAFRMVSRYATMGAVAMQGAAVAGATMGIKFAMANEQAIISFKTLLGSQHEAEKMFRDLQSFAATTPFEFPQLRDAASKLLTTGVAAEKVIPMMTAIGDATAAMGTGAEGIGRAVYALQQMNLVGKVTGMDMMQLANAGIPAWDALASAAGMSVQEVKKAVEKGTLQNSVQLLMSGIESYSGDAMGRVKGMMVEQSGTLVGLMSTLKDNVQIALGDMMKPATNAIKDALPAINDAVGETFKAMTGPVNKMVTTMMDAFTKLVPAIEPMMAALSTIMVAAIQAIVPAVAQMASVLPTLQPALEGMASIITDLSAVVAPLVVELVTGFVPIIGTMVSVVADATNFLVDHKGILEALSPVIGALVASYVAYKVAVKAMDFAKTAIDIGKMIVKTIALTTANGAQAASAAAAAAATSAQATATTAAAGAQTALNVAMYANPIGLVIAAVALLVVGFVLLWRKFEGFRLFWKRTWNLIIDATQFAINKILDRYEMMVNGVIKGVNLIIKAWNAVQWGEDVDMLEEVNFQLDITGAKVSTAASNAEDLSNNFKSAADYAKTLYDINDKYEKADAAAAARRKKSGGKGGGGGGKDDTKNDKIANLIRAAKDVGTQALNKAQAILDGIRQKADAFYDSIYDSVMGTYSFTNALTASLQTQQNYQKAADDVAAAQERVNKAVQNRDWDAYVEASKELSEATTNLEAAEKGQKTFMQALEDQYNKARDFAVLINRLRAAGLNEAGISQIVAAGAETGAAIANELLNGGSDAIGRANVWYTELVGTATSAAEAAKTQFYQQGLSQGEQLVKGIEDAVKKLDLGLAAKGISEKTIKTLVDSFNTTAANLNATFSAATSAPTTAPLIDMGVPYLDVSGIDFSGINMGFGVLGLASGGLVKATSGGTLARIGEGGQDEAVIPLNRSGLFDNMGNTYHITVQTGVGDKTAIGEELVSVLQRYEKRYGSVPIRTR